MQRLPSPSNSTAENDNLPETPTILSSGRVGVDHHNSFSVDAAAVVVNEDRSPSEVVDLDSRNGYLASLSPSGVGVMQGGIQLAAAAAAAKEVVTSGGQGWGDIGAWTDSRGEGFGVCIEEINCGVFDGRKGGLKM